MTKQQFPYLLVKLWDQSFLPQHFTSGFRLSQDAIPSSRLAKALPFTSPRPATEPHPQPDEPSASQADQDVAVELVI